MLYAEQKTAQNGLHIENNIRDCFPRLQNKLAAEEAAKEGKSLAEQTVYVHEEIHDDVASGESVCISF